MKIGEERQFFGKSYTAVYYKGIPADFRPSDDDAQCKICAIEPNYCKMMEQCHGVVPFIFVKTEYVKAMSVLSQL